MSFKKDELIQLQKERVERLTAEVSNLKGLLNEVLGRHALKIEIDNELIEAVKSAVSGSQVEALDEK